MKKVFFCSEKSIVCFGHLVLHRFVKIFSRFVFRLVGSLFVFSCYDFLRGCI